MKKDITQALAKFDTRLVFFVMLLIIAFILFEGTVLLIRKPYAEYQQLVSTRQSLAASLSQSPQQVSELDQITKELKQLTETLNGELHMPASDDKIAASLMKDLDHSAAAHGVSLISLKPGKRKQISVFEEASFEVSASGGYLQLCAWMLEFAKSLGNSATVTDFEMKSAEEGKKVLLTLNIALYRPLKLSEVAK